MYDAANATIVVSALAISGGTWTWKSPITQTMTIVSAPATPALAVFAAMFTMDSSFNA
jgi:hypothetical protein